MLLLISEHLMKQKEYEHAIKVYHKIGDFRNLALAYVSAQKWEEVRTLFIEVTAANNLVVHVLGLQNRHRLSAISFGHLSALCSVAGGAGKVHRSPARLVIDR